MSETMMKLFFFLTSLALQLLKKNVSIDKYDANFKTLTNDLEKIFITK